MDASKFVTIITYVNDSESLETRLQASNTSYTISMIDIVIVEPMTIVVPHATEVKRSTVRHDKVSGHLLFF